MKFISAVIPNAKGKRFTIKGKYEVNSCEETFARAKDSYCEGNLEFHEF